MIPQVLLLWIILMVNPHQPILNVQVSGINSIQGSIAVAVYDSQESFLGKNVVSSGIFKVTGNIVKGQLTLPFGHYGISVYHDVNGDEELNTKIFGIPKEPIGFSNNAKGSFGPPKFEDVLFHFSRSEQTVYIELY